MKNWKIVEKGNTIKSLAIEDIDGNKICSGISPKKSFDALLISKAPEMLRTLKIIQRMFSIGYVQEDHPITSKIINDLIIEIEDEKNIN